MATMDVFTPDAFGMIEMTAAINKEEHLPQFIGNLNLFDIKRVRTKTVMIEERVGTLRLVQTSERGAPLAQQTAEKRKVRNFQTVRLAEGDRLMADEVQGIRAFGMETEMQQVQAEVARRQFRLRRNIELTHEHMKLGAVQGIVLDADASVIVNFYDEFGIAQPGEIALDLANTLEGDLRPKIESQIVRPMIRASKGAFTAMSRIVGLCGDAFWDEFVNHKEVRTTFLNTMAAAQLREGTAFQSFNYAGVDWFNYRGTDDNSTVAIPTDTAKFFPRNAPGVFEVAYSPAEFFDFVNTPGQEFYAVLVRDLQRNAWVDPEVYSYPLFYCTRPEMLFRAKRGA